MTDEEQFFQFVSRETILTPERKENFYIYHHLLLQWAPIHNLVSKTTLKESWSRHFLDGAQLYPFLSGKEGKVILDVGTGAGFPGAVLHLMGIQHIHLVEIDQKKVSFLKNVSRETKSSMSIFNERIQDINKAPVDIFISRAVTQLDQFLEWIYPKGKESTELFLLKGARVHEEIQEAQTNWGFDYTLYPSITHKDGCIIQLKNIQRRSDKL